MADITLVDDDENIVASVSLALESHGHTVKAYYDGASSLAALESDPPDLAILDVKMPRMDGMEVLRRLRQTSELPVIMLTSKDEEIDEILGFNLGADDYIHKPFSQRLLIERVKALLRRVGIDGEEPSAQAAADASARAIRRGKLTLDPARHDREADQVENPADDGDQHPVADAEAEHDRGGDHERGHRDENVRHHGKFPGADVVRRHHDAGRLLLKKAHAALSRNSRRR